MESKIDSDGITRLARHYLERGRYKSRDEAHRWLKRRLGAYDIGGEAIITGIDQHFDQPVGR